MAERLKGIPPTLSRGHVVTLVLCNGLKIPDVFVLDGVEILGIYDRHELGFNPADITDLIATPENRLSFYDEKKWLRLDG
jgi:hypothetical protein